MNLGFEGKGDYYLSDRFVENASFLRCDNITVGYSFKNLLKSQAYKGINGRIYGTVQNPSLSPSIQDSILNRLSVQEMMPE